MPNLLIKGSAFLVACRSSGFQSESRLGFQTQTLLDFQKKTYLRGGVEIVFWKSSYYFISLKISRSISKV